MKISEIREALQECFGDFPEDARKRMASKLNIQPYQIGYAHTPFDDDTCYFIINAEDGVYVTDWNKDCIVVRQIK